MTADSIHIATSETPLESGVEQRALCGVVIPRARWLWTTDSPGAAYTRRVKGLFAGCRICAQCRLADWDGAYVYAVPAGLVNGK